MGQSTAIDLAIFEQIVNLNQGIGIHQAAMARNLQDRVGRSIIFGGLEPARRRTPNDYAQALDDLAESVVLRTAILCLAS